MQNTKKTTIYFILIFILIFNIKCKNNEIRSDLRVDKVDSISEKLIENKNIIESNSFIFNKVFQKQIFPLNYESSDLESEFVNKKIILDENKLYFLDCLTEIMIKKEITKKYLNGLENIEIYNEILSENNLKLKSEITYITPLYPENKCNLPSESIIMLNEENIIFVYKGYLLLFSKLSGIGLGKETSVQKIICNDEIGNIEDGYITNCLINDKLEKAYEIFINESKINEISFLKEQLPNNNIKYFIDETEVVYTKDKNNVSIELFFPGGETYISFTEIKNKTEISVKNFPQ